MCSWDSYKKPEQQIGVKLDLALAAFYRQIYEMCLLLDWTRLAVYYANSTGLKACCDLILITF